ncbi:MAG: alpha-N-arabinofuranosidase, partial [Bacteroidaceae bacterium]|nr:alpha-N-arabinofuranosidase [Bacteroidaceae bacterium]
GHMVLTPTYHVFKMYTPFQEALPLPVYISCKTMNVRKDYTKPIAPDNQKNLPLVSCSAAKKDDGTILVALANVCLDKQQEIKINLSGENPKSFKGTILTSKNIADHNDFEHPNKVKPEAFNNAKIKDNVLKIQLPAKSIVVLEVK